MLWILTASVVFAIMFIVCKTAELQKLESQALKEYKELQKLAERPVKRGPATEGPDLLRKSKEACTGLV